jgi:glutathione S-transferase
MIALHQYEISPFCDKVRRILNWKGLEYRIREVPVSRAMSVRKINPIGKLPCLEHDGHFVADSTDIACYLEEHFPEPPILPSEPAQRGLCQMLDDWADESLYFYEMRLRFTFPHNARRWVPELVHSDPGWMKVLAPRVIPGMMRRLTRQQGVGRKSDAQVLADIERQVSAVGDCLGGRSWLVGDALCLADLSVFAQLFCIRGAEEGARIIQAHPAVVDWMERVDRATGKSTAV